MVDEAPPSSFGDGRYAVTKLLGEGGQASSFQAVDKKAGRLVVVKRFRVRGAKSWKEVELAEREAKVLSTLAHESLPRYVDHFEEGGDLFVVTEYIEGESLAARQKRGERLGPADVARFLETAGKALGYLHGRAPPVVHRDIKPSNVLLRPDGSFAIIDFGAVRDRMKPEGGSTVVGTFGYMAPEQFQGRAMPASDVYAVGATALVLLTGVEPEDLPHKGLAIDVRAALAGVSVEPRLVRALERMLDPDPDTRAKSIAPLLASQNEDAPAPAGPASPKARRASADLPETDDQEDMNPWPFREDGRRGRRAERRAARKARKAERRARRSERRVRGYGEPLELGGAIGWIVHVALRIASLAVRVSLKVVIAMLGLLGGLFGRAMREAAETVRQAQADAEEEIARARAYTIGDRGPRKEGVRVEPVAGAGAETEGGAARRRVDPADAPSGEAGDAAHDEAMAEAEAEAEEAALHGARRTPGAR